MKGFIQFYYDVICHENKTYAGNKTLIRKHGTKMCIRANGDSDADEENTFDFHSCTQSILGKNSHQK